MAMKEVKAKLVSYLSGYLFSREQAEDLASVILGHPEWDVQDLSQAVYQSVFHYKMTRLDVIAKYISKSITPHIARILGVK